MPDRPTQILEAAARLIARSGVRGLRVEQVSAEAGVSTALIYYHFKDRAGLLRRTLEFINRRAIRYTDAALDSSDAPLAQLTEMLLLEFQETPRSGRTVRPGASCGPPPSSTRICGSCWPARPRTGSRTSPT